MKLIIALVAACFLATACGVQNADSGKPVVIPAITMACTASACLTGSNMFTVMYITTYGCSESSIELSVAASSSEGVTCSAVTGCNETFSTWVNNSGGSTTTVPSNTYNLCGIVANTTFAGSWAGHVVAVGYLGGVKIDGTTTATVNVSNWADGAVFP